MQDKDKSVPASDPDDPAFAQPRRPGEPLNIDARGGDWIKGDRTRLGHDGALYVPDPSAVSGTRRLEVGTAEW